MRDLERSTAFYRALGLDDVYYEGLLTGEQGAPIALPPSSRLRVRILKPAGQPNFGMVGLFEVAGPELAALPPADGPPRAGEATLVFYVADMDAAMEAARANGATWILPPVVFRMPHLEQREASVRDPDGVLVNFIESDPARQGLLAPEPHVPLTPR